MQKTEIKTLQVQRVPETISLLKVVKKRCIEIIDDSTMHGLPNVFRSNHFIMKIFWLILFLLSLALAIYLVSVSVKTFLNFDVTVSIAYEQETPIDFPAVTFCNLNPFYQLRAAAFINSSLSLNNISYLTSLTSIANTTNALTLAKMAMYYIKAEAVINQTIMQQIGFSLTDMLFSCTFLGMPCSTSDFTSFQSYEYGNCYTFNSGVNVSINKVSNAGPAHGLELELFAGDPKSQQYVYRSGFYVVVHNQSITPLMDSEGVSVSSGMETNIGVEREFISRLGRPYSGCVDGTTSESYDSPLYQAIFNTLDQTVYRQKYCFKLCYQQSVVSLCSCYDPQYPNAFPNSSLTVCQTTSQLFCMTNQQKVFETNGTNAFPNCTNNCPLECNSINYDLTLSTASYPTNFYLNWLLLQNTLTSKYSTKSNNSIQVSVAKINVFYNDMFYMSLTESPAITWDILLGTIGGTLGLFLGVSVLSVFEIFDIIFQIAEAIFMYKRNGKISCENGFKS